jgi:hypothetical protein
VGVGEQDSAAGGEDWDDGMILALLGEIIQRHRRERDTQVLFDMHGARVTLDQDVNELMNKLRKRLPPEGEP